MSNDRARTLVGSGPRVLLEQKQVAHERRQWLIEELQKGVDSPTHTWDVEELLSAAHARRGLEGVGRQQKWDTGSPRFRHLITAQFG